MGKEIKMKFLLLQILVSVLLCIFLIAIKFVLRQENIVEEIYNYLITDIVFLSVL